jgi:hypothetical protein
MRSSVSARAKAFYAVGIFLLGRVIADTAFAADVPSHMNRRFDVRDSVEMSYFGTLASSTPNDLDDDGVFSPDGRYFVKVTHRGVLPQGLTEGTIWLFDTAAIRQSLYDLKLPVPKPVSLARMSASVNGGLGLSVFDAGNSVSAPQWSEDSQHLTFLGRNGRANRQLFRVDLQSRKVEALTAPSQDVLAYAKSRSEFVYLAGPDADLQAERAWVSAGPGIPDMTVGTGTPLMPLLYPYFRGNAYGEPVQVELWRIHEDHVMPVVDARTGASIRLTTRYTSLLVSLSSDAERVVTIGNESATDDNSDQSNAAALAVPRYLVIDLNSGRRTALDNVPLAKESTGRYRAAWTLDNKEIAVTKVLVARSDDKPQPSFCEIAVLHLDPTRVRCITDSDQKVSSIVGLEWPAADEIRVQYKDFGQAGYSERALHRHASSWTADKRPLKELHSPIKLSVHESLNEPPVLVAADSRTGKSRPIFDPNPQLANIALGSASIYRWKDPHGREDMGGLVLPPNITPGRRYGLVIQTHGFDPGRFFRAGYSDTSNAGRALAGRDLVVLQVDEPGTKHPSWRDGIELGVDVYLAAIDKLAAEGVVDPTRVGISGYSYSGWLVANAITRAPQRFSAAEIANSDPVTLTGYYEYVGTPLAAADANFYVGTRPYGEGLQKWIERAPSFSTDKIIAPVLFQPADPWHLLGIWDMYAAMLDQGKPVELQYMRTGEHNIRKPLQVFAHQEMIVDWFDFWLNGHEDSDSAKAKQYERWDKLREARDLSEKSAIH